MNSTQENAMTQQINNEKVWNLYSSGAVGLEKSIRLAAQVKCMNGKWELPEEVEVLCAAMLSLGEDVFQFMDADNHEDRMEYFGRVGAYHRLQKAVEETYPEELGHLTDPWTAETFSEIYKDRNGFRPSNYTAKEMREWLNGPEALLNEEA